MQSIKLTKQQRSRLIKLVKIFFPELQKEAEEGAIKFYGSKRIANQYWWGIAMAHNRDVVCRYPVKTKQWSSKEHKYLINPIHWYEFCLTQLADKIFSKVKMKLSDEEFENLASWTDKHPFFVDDIMDMSAQFTLYPLLRTHPVDFLYEVFVEGGKGGWLKK